MDDLFYNVCISDKKNIDLQYPGDSTSAVITDLLSDTTYNVTVTALLTTEEGLSPVGPIQLNTCKYF